MKKKRSEKKLIFLQYRGKATENFERALRRINALFEIINTIKKMKTVLLSLKAPVEKAMKSEVVYQISFMLSVVLCWANNPTFY